MPDPGRNRRRVRRGPHQQGLDGGGSRSARHIGRVGDDEGVVGRCRELANDADVVERDHVVRVIGGELEPEPDQVSRLELEVAHRLVGDQDAVRLGGQRAQDLRGVATGEERIGHVRGRSDARRVDPVEVLEIVSYVRVAVLHRLGRAHARDRPHAGGEAGRQPREGGRRDRDVRTVRELGIDPGLSCVGRVEHRRRQRERRGERHDHESAREQPPLSCHRGGHHSSQPTSNRSGHPSHRSATPA